MSAECGTRNVELFRLNPIPNCLPNTVPNRPSKATIGGAGLFTRWNLEKTASEVKGGRSPDDRVLHSPVWTSADVLRGKG
jgi:hypothetical protein